MTETDKILLLVKEAQALNGKMVSLPRILVLTALEDLGQDGSSYRELKAGLNLDDGVLFSNLKVLEEMRYIKSKDVTVENKKLTSYAITNEGKEALVLLRSWFKKWVMEWEI
ncbi:MAG: transcriptional regulator [Candidatus Micrarchaeota archaeon]|nr:transcriptional regulator [Candidatus Micrarchaeota archaeon]